jgi:hydroxymethylglutaryl-CoA reductase
MAVEETSIIAAASSAAKWIKSQGELTTQVLGELILGQIQIPRVQNIERATQSLESGAPELVRIANQMVSSLVERGGGVKKMEVRILNRADGQGKMIVLHVHCDPCDAMGANLINQVCEGLKPFVEEMSGEKVGLCILSNLVDGKLVQADVTIQDIDPQLGAGICEASVFAQSDPYRAATHNKGVLNGIDPILIATGNDWRAVEAGIHAYAARSGQYQPVTVWKMEGNHLHGRIQVPLAVGSVGGVTRVHPLAQVALKILGIEHARDLAKICAAVGLVQNLAALKALSTVGIVRGHMELHASNLALAVGSKPSEVILVSRSLTQMLQQGKKIGSSVAHEILNQLRVQPSTEQEQMNG